MSMKYWWSAKSMKFASGPSTTPCVPSGAAAPQAQKTVTSNIFLLCVRYTQQKPSTRFALIPLSQQSSRLIHWKKACQYGRNVCFEKSIGEDTQNTGSGDAP